MRPRPVSWSESAFARRGWPGDGKRLFENAGGIDEPEVCTPVADTMGGVEKPSIDRKDKYGY